MNEVQTQVVEDELMVLAPVNRGDISRLYAGDAFDTCYRLAQVMADGKMTTPKHFQGNVADCMALCTQAMLWQMNPFAVAQKTHIVNGTLGYESQLIIAVINNCGLLEDRIDFDWEGPWDKLLGKGDKGNEDGCKVTAYATLKGETDPRELTLEMCQASVRNSPLWKSDPRQQLAYLAAKRWARLYAPDAILGVYSPDELAEIQPRTERDITPRQTPAQIGQAARGQAVTEGEEAAERAKLIEALESTAKADGPAGLQVHWKDVLTAAHRKLVGAEELDRLKTVAAESVKAAQAAKTSGDPDPEFVAGMDDGGGNG